MRTTGDGTTGHHQTAVYEIRVKGHLEDRWAAFFDGVALTRDADGTTAIRAPVADQAALHGLLRTLTDVGLPLISVTPATATPTDPTTADRTTDSRTTRHEGDRP